MIAAANNPGADAPRAASVRVVEFGDSGIAAAYAEWLLALMGAEVTRLVVAERTESPEDPLSLSLALLAQNKTTARMPTRAAEVASLLTDCDVLICDQPDEIAELIASGVIH